MLDHVTGSFNRDRNALTECLYISQAEKRGSALRIACALLVDVDDEEDQEP